MNQLPEKAYLAALSHLANLGPARLRRLKNTFAHAHEMWQADLPNLIAAGIEENVAARWIDERSQIDPAHVWARLAQEQVTLITPDDDRYPTRLKEIPDAPAWLYCTGALERLSDLWSIAVVGTRKISPYGKRVTEDIVAELVTYDITIVSGLALGIDACAHATTLDRKGKTIAVLASGVDTAHIYPASHQSLAQRIVASGGLIASEYPIGTKAFPQQFPYRNRIISALTLGTLVIEAPLESGALLTARYALEQNREVFAVPGDIYATNTIGTNNLIKMGAKAVTSATDILETLNITALVTPGETRPILPASPNEALILQHLADQPLHVDELVRVTSLAAPILNATLVLMEMSGKVRNLGGMHYVRGR